MERRGMQTETERKETRVPLDPNRELSPQEEDLIARLLACAMGLPRVCRFKACRRRKRCLGPDVVCAKHPSGLVAERLQRAIARIAAPAPEP